MFGCTEQGKVFFGIHLGTDIIIILAIISTFIKAGLVSGCAAEMSGISFLTILITAGALASVLFATWGATKLFDIDFFVAYQIMTFGQCLCTDTKKKDD